MFDCDGLLVSSDAAWTAAYQATITALGGNLGNLDLRALLGASVSSAAVTLSQQIGRPIDEDRLHHELLNAFEVHPPTASPGARALLETLSGRIPLAVASNGPTQIVIDSLRQAGLLHHLSEVVTAETAGSPKPAPDTYLQACGRLNVDPTDAIALEDSLIGTRAAANAGLLVVGVALRQPAARALVDLHVPRLSDPRLLQLLVPASTRNGRTTSRPHA